MARLRKDVLSRHREEMLIAARNQLLIVQNESQRLPRLLRERTPAKLLAIRPSVRELLRVFTTSKTERWSSPVKRAMPSNGG